MAKKSSVKIPSARDLFEAGVHFGHSPRRWHPKMAPFIYGEISRIHIFDLEKTAEKLEEASNFLYEIAKNDGVILFVALKRQFDDLVRHEAERCGAMYITERWPGGLLTNFAEVSKNITKLEELEKGVASGSFSHYTKKEQLEIDREIARLKRLIGGVRGLKKLPDALFLTSAKRARTAVREARALGIPTAGVVDSNMDPSPIDYPIPGNDDSLKSLSILVTTVAEAIAEGYGKENPKTDSGSSAKQSLGGLNLTARVQHSLEQAGITSFEGLRALAREDLTKIKGIGEKSADEIGKLLNS